MPIGIDATGPAQGDRLDGRDRRARRPLLGGADAAHARSTSRSATTACPSAVYHAYGYVKKAAALVNAPAGGSRLEGGRDRSRGRRDDRRQARRRFPALRLADRLGHPVQHERQRGDLEPGHPACSAASSAARRRSHPNDDVNMGQSSNDTFPTAMHIAARAGARGPSAAARRGARRRRSRPRPRQWSDVVKIGRTHLEDAVPLTVGQEWSGYAHADSATRWRASSASLHGLYELAAGGTAVGTGLNAPPDFGRGDRRQDRRADRAALRDRAQQVRRPGLARRAWSRAMAALRGAGGRADEDRQRHALAGLRAALRARRADAAGQRAGLLHHARQGQPDPVRGDGHGLHPGDRRRRRRRLRRRRATSSSTPCARSSSTTSCTRPACWPTPATSSASSGRGHRARTASRSTTMSSSSLMLVTALSPVIGYDKASAIAHKANDEGLTPAGRPRCGRATSTRSASTRSSTREDGGARREGRLTTEHVVPSPPLRWAWHDAAERETRQRRGGLGGEVCARRGWGVRSARASRRRGQVPSTGQGSVSATRTGAVDRAGQRLGDADRCRQPGRAASRRR